MDNKTNTDKNGQNNEPICLSPIGKVHSPYKEKFAIPRQPGLVSQAHGNIELFSGRLSNEMVAGLSDFSHIWVLFIFHQTQNQGWKSKVRPPRLGGNKKLGVLATRSTFRPNPIGMSVVKLDKITESNQGALLAISGLDLLDQTPVLDIKPYVGYSDAVTDANSGFAAAAPETNIKVIFSEQAIKFCNHCQQHDHLLTFIEQVLKQDPRPAYRQGKVDDKVYGVQLYNYNISFCFSDLTTISVMQINPI
ncbi:MAG: tRNA (N6-threonylcarbamoyladenosine(37)-N6)-methyltransferase TrmO [Pseudoalteromonas spongiae]